MAHVNPRKGHVMATEEEVRNGSHDGAMREELKSFQRNEVLKVGGVRVPARKRVMKTRWVLTWKMKGGERVPKARLVCKGFQDDRKNVKTYSGTAAWWALLVCFVFASTKGWKVGKSDVRTTFLTTPISDDVFVQLPGRVPEGSPEGFASGEMSQLLRAMYNLKDAPRLYAGLLARESGPTSSREEKGVQVAQEDEGVQEAQDDGRKREKEKKEKEKRVMHLSVDKKVIDIMMAHVNPRKGHVMATEEEVRNGSHDGAMREELKSFQRNEVLKVGGVRVPARKRVMKTRWVLTWKMKGGERVPKARLVCKGFQDDRKNVKTYSGTAAWWALLVCFVFASTKGWKVGKSDVRTTFLTTPISDDVFVQLPGRVPEGSPEGFASGEMSQLLRAMYNLKDAPRLYGQHFKRIAGECGWEEVTDRVAFLVGNRSSLPVIAGNR
uniref:Reverse transcriptase Ty1/copia-type domain-containing protein n=1 Tax=Chromera velia CCMP2878 TaxID=1169474 RepID=A0A0K6SAM0_9ALVE|eukprot:Cvel_10296.t2-p1 / transcript=Cvel_10296.t2 / gene=Cvel_10296 / organism=Chromera_velia_CCMP2878 / gene_product=Retrovirus-related Pol polyprotein from transposon, putative / transcript_product=Retrovirus-related Pol polyprotein from transposon, putative / location=Cvel_scaffold618:18992-20689(-) / protein_length=437 / sequence_SO=supercontig / SO=protein_coding / is_pseudo=false